MSSIAVCWRGSALTALLVACTTAAFAAEGTPSRAVSASAAMAARQSALATAQGANQKPRGARQAAAGTTQAGEIYANPFRAYPPSCLGDGLPFRTFPQSTGDPAPQQQSLTLPGDPGQCFGGGNAQECNYSEVVTVTVWRVACANNQAAVLVEIDRPAANEANTTLYPTFPFVGIAQGNSTLAPVRMADDPNTIYSTTSVNTAVYSSDIYVLENYANDQATQVDYTKAFVLSLDNTISFTFPDYNKSQYAAANQGVPISGYLSTNWYNPLESGEGMLTQIYDDYNDTTGTKRTFTAAWYTFDPLGLPFWLYAQGSITIGDRAANNIQVFYASNGKFAGSGNATFTQWGTANFSFPDCDHMVFTYTGNADAVNGPTGSGTRTWSRLTNINSLVCN